MAKSNRYEQIIERIFLSHYEPGAREVTFSREEIGEVAAQLGVKPPKNIGDLLYSFRYRAPLPASIQERAPVGEAWIIRSIGPARYRFVATAPFAIVPNPAMAETKVPDSTPALIARYALTDEQALLAKVRYNRLIDVFTGVACYSLQNHLRTTVPSLGQVETDEIYVGVDQRGAQYVFPIQAKGGKDRLSVVQIEQDLALCADKFSGLICRPIAAQFMGTELIALFAFEDSDKGIALSSEKHYRLVPPEDVTPADLDNYRSRSF